MRLEDEQYEEIKRTVIDTFSVYGIRCIPISAFEMATKMGIKVIPYSALSEEKRSAAMRESKDGFSIGSSRSQEWMIFYNDACESYGRINQTIMPGSGSKSGSGRRKSAEEVRRSCKGQECSLLFVIGKFTETIFDKSNTKSLVLFPGLRRSPPGGSRLSA